MDLGTSKIKKCKCKGACEQWFSASDEVGEDCKAVYPENKQEEIKGGKTLGSNRN